jgi:hypothetical protein
MMLAAPPQGVAASSGARCMVRVTWQDLSGEMGYRIYRNGSMAGSVAADVLQFNDVVPAGTYDYCVAAFDSCGETARSCATGSSASPPSLFLGTNGNYYERVTVPFFTWTASKAAAESYRFLDEPGHLATVSNGVENDFLAQLGAPNYWLGGYQDPNGTNHAANWHWVKKEPFVYTAWATGEPNESQPDEIALEMKDEGGGWNDVRDDDPNDGFIVEYDIGHVLGTMQGCIASDRFLPIRVSWQAAAGAAGYHVYRDNDLIAIVPPGVTSLADPTIGGPYLYCVRALNPCGNESQASCDEGKARRSGGGGAPPARAITIDSGPLTLCDGGVLRRNGHTTLRVQMGARAGHAEVSVYDARGRAVQTLLDEGLAAHASELVRWDGRDRNGRRAAPGVYVFRFVAPGIEESRKILYVP